MKKDNALFIRIPTKLKKQLQREADKNIQSLNAYIISVLLKEVMKGKG